MASVLVFGPTGGVASWAARTAHGLGAKVWLAMRDPSKAIPGLSKEQEQAGKYERLQADLTKPDTLTAAAKTSGAKRAFIYLTWGAPDHMKGALEALKAGGVTFIVFLSSFTIYKGLHEIEPAEVIPYAHARVEISLHEVYGEGNFAAVRPGGFATNLLWNKAGIDAGDAKIISKDWESDFVTPVDMGSVAGTILVKGVRNGQNEVYVYGPQRIDQEDAIGRVGKALGKDITVTPYTEDEYRAVSLKAGHPEPLIEYMLTATRRPKSDTSKYVTHYDEGVQNVQDYLGRPATGFDEWLKDNLDLFRA